MTESENQATITDGQIVLSDELVEEDRVEEARSGDELVPEIELAEDGAVALDGDVADLEDASREIVATILAADEFCTCEEDVTNDSNNHILDADTEEETTNSHGVTHVADGEECQDSPEVTATEEEEEAPEEEDGDDVDEDVNANNNSSLDQGPVIIDCGVGGNVNQSADDDDDDDDDDDEGEDLVDPREKLKERCAGNAECKPLGRLLKKCNARLEDGDLMFVGETCTEELFNFLQCVDNCVAKDIIGKLK